MPNFRRRPLSALPRLKPLAAALALALSGPALGNPGGATVVNGNVSMTASGNTLTVTNSPGAIINWQNFSIGADEITRFVQQSASSTVLNRVVGADPSSILGSLQSNGHVWLINPNGIIFGEGARIDVAGLVASSLDIGNQDFLNGLYKFAGSGAEGKVSNAGNIAAHGGPVLLFAPDVENSGVITNPNGEIILAAGHSVELAEVSNPALRVTVSAGGTAVNLGQLIAQGGSINMTGGLVRQSGIISASSAVSEGGRIFLRADTSVSLDANSVTEANGTQGGQIGIEGDMLIQNGSLSATGSSGTGGSVAADVRFAGLSGDTDVSGVEGGSLTVNAESAILTGSIAATGSFGAGGAVSLKLSRSLQQTQNSVIDAGSQQAAGGTVRLSMADGGSQYLSGAIKADGDTGGKVVLEGGDLTLAGARISATGAVEGGSIFAGGGAHGADASIRNAHSLKANAETRLDASARDYGNGGEVIVWSDARTAFVGNIAARGGSAGGDGGFVEVSSGDKLGWGGQIDVAAPNGKIGSALFDPYDINIETLVPSGFTTIELADPAPNSADSHGSGGFEILPNGNIVVASPNDSDVAVNAGAVYLYRPDGTLVSLLYGTQAYDQVGSGVSCVECSTTPGITVLPGGNFLINSPNWSNGVETQAGAVTWGSADTGVNGPVSEANSLVGSTAYDNVGGNGITVLSNGNYLVVSPNWYNPVADAGAAGAVTWGSGTSGVSGAISESNSLVGGNSSDSVGGYCVTELANGNYVVVSPYWNGGRGAVTWADGNTGISGLVSEANSLVGARAGDYVGEFGVTALANGNYVVISPDWYNPVTMAAGAGAVTWGDGSTGITGLVSEANSLVGSTYYDNVGMYGVTELANGNYVVITPWWDNGAIANAGAVTWGNGSTGISGVVSAANSLVGASADDWVGNYGVTALANGNYVVGSPLWDNGATADVGAVTWGNGSTGVSGVVSAANSLVGASAGDQVGDFGVIDLGNGNYVVRSPYWDNGAAVDAGAVTWGNGGSGISGVVSAANSLVGSTNYDAVGGYGVVVLTNGNYLVRSPWWDNGAIADAGAVTWGNGSTGVSGVVSASNSLVGGTNYDAVGSGTVTALANGNYVVASPYWDNGAIADAGAATWGNGGSGTNGVVSAANSLVGSTASDYVGMYGIDELANGNFVVRSPNWDNGTAVDAGAATWVNGGSGQFADGSYGGAINSANSLVGNASGDTVGLDFRALNNGNYVVNSMMWHGGLGASTWGNGATGAVGEVSALNSLVGSAPGDYVGNGNFLELANGNYVLQAGAWGGSLGAVAWVNGATGQLADGSYGGQVSALNSLVGTSAGDYVGNNGLVALDNGNYLALNPGNTATVTSGSISFGDGGAGTVGVVSSANSLMLGGIPPQSPIVVKPYRGNSFVFWQAEGDAWSAIGGQVFLAQWGSGMGSVAGSVFGNDTALNYSLDPSAIAALLDGGVDVTLQAQHDINVNAEIDTAPKTSVSLNLQANNDINLNADIRSTGAALNLNLLPDADFDGAGMVRVLGTAVARMLATAGGAVTVDGWLSVENSLDGGGAGALDVQKGFSQTAGTSVSGFDTIAIVQESGDLSVGNLSVNVPAGGFDGASDGVIWLAAPTGSISQQTGTTLAGAAVGAQASGSVTLTENNPTGVVFGSSASGDFAYTSSSPILVTWYDGAFYQDGIQAAGNVSLSTSGAITFDSQASASSGSLSVSAGGDATVNAGLSAGQDIALDASGSVTLNNTLIADGSSIIVAAGGDFINNAGAGALSAANGRWLVYAADPATSSFGGLDSGNHAIWGRTSSSYVPAAVTETGNRYIFAWQPTVTLTGNTFSKTYGDDLSTSIAGAYTVSGLYPGVAGAFLADTEADALSGAPGVTSIGAAANAPVNGGAAYAVSVGPGTLSSPSGYLLAFADGALTIDKANATVTANSSTVTYNGLTQSVTGFTATGLVNGETVAVLTGVSESGGSGRNAGTYVHSASGSDGNYNLTFVDGALTIDKANATVTANSATVTYNGQQQSVSGFTANGLVNGETEAVLTGVIESGGSGRNAGTYGHSASGSDGNYNLSFVDGALTIDKAPLTLAAVSDSRTFDGGAASAAAPLVSGLQGSDSVSGLSQAFDSRYVGNRTLSIIGYSVNDGNGGNNYTVTTTTASGSILVDPANFVWVNPAGGSWENGMNWNQGVAPVNGSQVTMAATAAGITYNSTSTIKTITSASDLTLQSGTLTLGTAPGDVSSFSGGAGLYVDGGALALNGATLISQVIVNRGLLSGYGTIVGNVDIVGGTLSPGPSAATLNINGDLTLGSGSALNMELGDPLNPAASDQINVSGQLTEAGALRLSAINGYVPAKGDSFTLFTFAGESGGFASMALPGQSVGLSGGILEILGQTGTAGTQIVQVLDNSAAQISTGLDVLFSVLPVLGEGPGNNEGDQFAGMVCSGWVQDADSLRRGI